MNALKILTSKKTVEVIVGAIALAAGTILSSGGKDALSKFGKGIFKQAFK